MIRGDANEKARRVHFRGGQGQEREGGVVVVGEGSLEDHLDGKR